MALRLQTPISEADARALKLGDEVLLSGRIYTARDAAHKFLAGGEKAPVLPAGLDFSGTAIYHCGPVMIQENGAWRVTAAGPTTSAREETYQGEVIRRFGVRAVIGKGGMGPKTRQALQDCGAVYLSAVGGAAQVLAAAVKRVVGVYFWEEFGSPEAIWALDVQDFPAIVTMDAHGNDLHQQVSQSSKFKVESAKCNLLNLK